MDLYRSFVAVISALVASVALAAQGVPVYTAIPTYPTAGAACSGGRVQIQKNNGAMWCCIASVWTACGSAAGFSPGGVAGNLQTNNGAGGFGAYAGSSCAYAVKALDASGGATCTSAPTIPADVTAESVITYGASAPFTNERTLAAGTNTTIDTSVAGQIKVNVPTGAGLGAPVSLANGGTGAALAGTNGALVYGSGGTALAHLGVGTTGQILFGNTGSPPTWSTLSLTGTSVTANQGTTTTVLHGNAAGLPSWAAVAPADLVAGATTPDNSKFYRGDGTWQTAPVPPATTALKTGTIAGGFADYGGFICTNQFARALSASGTATCSSVALGTDVSGTLTQAQGGTGAGALTCAAGQHLTSNGTAYSCSADTGGSGGTLTRLTTTWTSAATAGTLGIIGTGNVPLTSPTYAANALFYFYCIVLDAPPAATNGPRYGITGANVGNVSINATVALSTGQAATYYTYTTTSGNCASGCTSSITGSVMTVIQADVIHGAGYMSAVGSGTLSLQMAPSAAAAHTIDKGSYCIWY